MYFYNQTKSFRGTRISSTMAIANRAESPIFKCLGVIVESAKSLGFCFVQKKKEKTKPKGFAKCLVASNRLSAALLAIAGTLAVI